MATVHVPDVPAPPGKCWKQGPLMHRCTHDAGHAGPHTWEPKAATLTTLLVAALLVGLAVPVAATPIVLTGSPAWTAADGTDFWANVSYDRNGFAHVGVFLAGTPGSDIPHFYANSPYLSDLTYLGTGSTTFRWSTASPIYTPLVGVTSWVDRFWIDAGVLFFASPYDVWRSDTLDHGRTHFAVFDSPTAYYVGMEDATFTTPRPADWDYNDLVVRIPKATTPEPGGAVLLLGLGLVALVVWRSWQ